MFTLIVPDQFLKTASKFFKHHPDLKSQFEKIIEILIEDPLHPSLQIHSLKGKLRGLSAIRLTYKYRITLILQIEKKEITFIDIGSHNNIYR